MFLAFSIRSFVFYSNVIAPSRLPLAGKDSNHDGDDTATPQYSFYILYTPIRYFYSEINI